MKAVALPGSTAPLRGYIAAQARDEVAPLLSDLARLTRSLADAKHLEELVERAAEQALATVGCASVSISRIEPGAGMLRTLINVGSLGPTEERWPRDETYGLQDYIKLRGIVDTRQIWTIEAGDAEADGAELVLLERLGKRAALAAPLIVNDAIWGELYITFAAEHALPSAEIRAYLEVHLAIVESALTRVIQLQSLERLAFEDPLTGLANRRALDQAADVAFATLRQDESRTVTVAALDLNGLKQVNDLLGHAEGDRLIITAAAAIQMHFNDLPGSLTARVGGDEFIVLVPGHASREVMAVAHRSSAAVAALPLGNGMSCGIATAIGTARYSCPGELFRSADAALYRSKRTGRLVALGASAPAKNPGGAADTKEPTDVVEPNLALRDSGHGRPPGDGQIAARWRT